MQGGGRVSHIFSGISVAVIGGDDRQLILIEELSKLGATVKVIGFPREILPDNVVHTNELAFVLKDANAVILTMPGTDNNGLIRGANYVNDSLYLTPELLSSLPHNTPVLVGVQSEYLKYWAHQLSLKMIEIANEDEIAILNSIPTAEGALEIAMRETPITIHGSKSLVIGLGRVGLTLARLLQSMGSQTFVTARRRACLARGYEMGLSPVDLRDIKGCLQQMDFIFNTVPALVLGYDELLNIANPTLIIDLASAPGGVNFKKADELGLKVIWALSLPGKVAPKTAGEILAQTVPRIILKNLP